MLGMALRASLFVGKCGVQSAPLRQFSRDFGVAFLALQYRRARSGLVATGALRGPAERFMRLG